MPTFRSVHQPVMGTVLDLRIAVEHEEVARDVEVAVLGEARRLEAAFTVFDEGSELCRWRRGEVADPSVDLVRLLRMALDWQVRSGGAFNPAAGVLTARWLRAAEDGAAPDRGELRSLASSIAEPRIAFDERGVRPAGDGTAVDLNAIAKGFVVDRALEAGLAVAPDAELTVNAGGDLAHRGGTALRVGVEDPLRPYDNIPPLALIELRDEALATSGAARRWFQVGERRFNRVLDPRTGWPVEHVSSASVVAPDAATADVAATVASVLPPGEAAAQLDDWGLACMLVEPDGTRHETPGWRAAEVRRPGSPAAP